jgi:hypothetical protein
MKRPKTDSDAEKQPGNGFRLRPSCGKGAPVCGLDTGLHQVVIVGGQELPVQQRVDIDRSGPLTRLFSTNKRRNILTIYRPQVF